MYIVAGSERKVIVERGHLDAVLDKRLHHRVDLLAGEYEVTHDHRLVAHWHEGEPGAEGEAGLDLDSVERDFQVGARQADAINSTGLDGALLPQGLTNRLPVGLGCGGSRHRERD
jgi:hypothetical protein